MGLIRYIGKKAVIYLATFFVAVTLNWAIPRFMPGNPIGILLSRFATLPESAEVMYSYFTQAFGLDKPLYEQYINFWRALLNGDLGVSIYLYPQKVRDIVLEALPYDIVLIVPAVIVSWIVGNWLGALASTNRRLDNILMPIFYFLTASPYFWMAIVLAWVFTVTIPIFPPSGAYSPGISPSLSLSFIVDFLKHWILPFLSLLLVMLGGWAIGMRNMIIYELESNYSRYMEALGAPNRLILRYAFRNAMLPQITGLALQIGLAVAGAITTEIVFSYPGLGYLMLQAIQNQDYFLMQGAFLVIVIMVLISNFVIDIVYAIVDPRVRYTYTGETG
ncbi:MAG: ABC transporter permease [Desulfurococcales archaeon]|nr:ABC transporter permease [Desulfurococcales archaeon]MEB3780312.1 ABC transporter permease [Desulfurococcales archaeon]